MQSKFALTKIQITDTKKKCVLEINNSEYADRHSLKGRTEKNQYVEFDHVILC